MEIVGVLVQACPGKLDRVARALADLPGVEVHARADPGRLVTTVEARGDHPIGDTLLAINRSEGVLSATLVYHHFEEDPGAARNEEQSHEAVSA
jgi:nitrate reductase NapD